MRHATDSTVTRITTNNVTVCVSHSWLTLTPGWLWETARRGSDSYLLLREEYQPHFLSGGGPRITLKTCKPGHRLGITDTESGAKWKRFLLSEDQRRKRPLSIVPGSDNGAIITVQQLKSKTFSTKERHFKESCPHKCHLLISWSISCVFATHAAVTLTCFSLPTFAAVSFSNCFNPLPSQSHLSKLHLI